MKRLAIALLLLTGCAGIRAVLGYSDCAASDPQSVEPPVSARVLRETWEARFGPLPKACDTPWLWDVVSTSDQWRLCHTLNDAACTVYPQGCPVTFVTIQYAADKRLAAHEWAHWALHCSKGDGDPQHTNAAVWGAYGFVPSFGR